MANYKYKKNKSSSPDRNEMNEEVYKEIFDILYKISDPEVEFKTPGLPPFLSNLNLVERATYLLENLDTKAKSSHAGLTEAEIDSKRGFIKGSVNQYYGALYARTKETHLGSVYLAKGQIGQLFGYENVKEFDQSDDNIMKYQRIKSSGSFFMPNSRKSVHYVKPDNTRWRAFDEKGKPVWRSPTNEEIKNENLKRKEDNSLTFSSYAVWSLEDIYEHLPDNVKNIANELNEKRKIKLSKFNPEDDFHTIVKSKSESLLKQQGFMLPSEGNKFGKTMNLTMSGAGAAYYPLKDRLKVPTFEEHSNPVFYYRSVAHELAHSTKHLLGRAPFSLEGDKISYAIEEIVAETTAYFMVERLREEMIESNLYERADVKQAFEDYDNEGLSYIQDYGSIADLRALIQVAEESFTKVYESGKTVYDASPLVKDIANSIHQLTEVSVNFEQRLEALNDNMNDKKWTALVNTLGLPKSEKDEDSTPEP